MNPIPLKAWIAQGLEWLRLNCGAVFDGFARAITAWDSSLEFALRSIPPWALILVVAGVLIWRRGFGIAAAVAAALLLVWDLRLWNDGMHTVSLALMSAGISIVLGVPLGILVAESRRADRLITPVLDYMQTTPAFVYLIPSVVFFGIGAAPGVFATVMFALPPLTRNVALGIREVDPRTIEAVNAFGATPMTVLTKVKLPLALPYFAIGINQCIMMSFSMVVMAALIGARGLGTLVVASLAQVDFPAGIEAGVAVVAIAVALDQMSRPTLGRFRRKWLFRRQQKRERAPAP
ncbi:MAG: glycine betaine/L-proline transporter, permease protein [Reyranella sp.]|nr:glycine betaine/L-proline transporter, permease protein [Reyranella sp.]